MIPKENRIQTDTIFTNGGVSDTRIKQLPIRSWEKILTHLRKDKSGWF
jgi:hypothetical protein